LKRIAAIACVIACSAAYAQDYPTKPVRFIIAAGPAGSTDSLARVVGDKLGPALRQPIVYDNRPSSGGIIAGEVASHASADGYTLLFSTSAAVAVSVSLYKKLPYDPVKSFTPVVLVATQPYMLIAHPSSAGSVKELIAMAKAKPGLIGFAHTGAGSGTHLTGELFQLAAHVKLLSVPYKTSVGSVTAVVSGEVPLTFTSVFFAYAQAKAGRARALAVTGATRSPAAKDVPTFAEAGLPGYVTGNWYGMLAPAGTPRSVVTLLNTQVNAALKRPDVSDMLVNQGFDPAGGSPQEFAKFIGEEIAKYAAVIKAGGIRAD
jgi:tripartite-type tricarboxylate transporter receptor subunit TctC